MSAVIGIVPLDGIPQHTTVHGTDHCGSVFLYPKQDRPCCR